MSTTAKTGALNIVFRALTLVSRFILLMFLAKYLPADSVGVWGLVNVTIAMSLFALSIDFYQFNTREILARDPTRRVAAIRDQFVLHLITYGIVLPLLLFVFVADLIAWQYLAWFYVLLVIDHVSHEATQILVTLSRPVLANAVVFIRSGVWAYAVVGLMALEPGSRTLYAVWTGWIIGGLSSLVLALYGLRSLPWRAARGIPIDWKWMRGGVRVALPFLGATLSFQGVQYADRYFLQHYRGEAAVGVYTFFAGIANIVHVFVFSGVNQILYPRLIDAYQKGSMDRYRAIYRKLATGIIAGTALLSAAAAVLVYPLLSLIGKSEYIEHHRIFYIMLFTVSLLTVSYLPHYSLYVRRADRQLVLATVMSFVVAATGNWLLVPHYGLAGAAFATASAMAALLAGKLTGIYAVRTIEPAQRRTTDE